MKLRLQNWHMGLPPRDRRNPHCRLGSIYTICPDLRKRSSASGVREAWICGSTRTFTFSETGCSLCAECRGEARMTVYYAAVATVFAVLAIIAIAFLVSSARFPSVAAAATTPAVYRIRSVYFAIIVGAAVVSLAFTLPRTPYAGKFGDSKPELTVKAVGEMWSWSLSADAGDAPAGRNVVLPVGKLVQFEVTSKDVNHNFAIYDSAGQLIAQVQSMPDFTNRLFHTFDVPGHYYVLCLEYCGVAHHAMNAEFDVK
jgi:cytochrome c oxidase subunit II